MSKKSLIRTIYIYLFSAVGLILLIIGTVRFIDMGLKATVFKEAQNVERLEQSNYSRPYPTIDIGRYEDEEEVTDQEIESLKRMINNYEEEEKKWEDADRYLARKQEEASYNLAFILVGLPLFLYHWRLVKKDN